MKFKYTLAGQFLDVVKTHIVAAFIFSILWFMLIAVTITDTGGIIFSIIGTLCYFISMYNCGFDALTNDKKTYSKQSPDLRKCIILTAALAVVNLIMIVMYRTVWTLYGSGTTLTSVGGIVGNVLAIIWFSPYEKLAGMVCGSFSIAGYVMVFLLPAVAVAAGYAAGYFGYDISGKLSGIMYEKTKNKKKGK